jgi:uncharacterized membrane protein
MDLSAVPLPPGWTLSGLLLAAPVLAAALRSAPWDRFASSEITHVFYGGIFATVVLWSLRATVGEGFAFHLLGVGVFTLLAGPALALIGTAIALAVVWGTWRVVERLLPPNFFIYIFATAFLGSALALGAAGLAGSFVLVEAGGRDAAVVWGDYAPYLLYLAFGEGTLGGMIITLLVVYRPGWVATFDDARYLTGR